MKTKFRLNQHSHPSPIALAATKSICSQSRTSPVAARCACRSIVEFAPEGPNEDIDLRDGSNHRFLYRIYMY